MFKAYLPQNIVSKKLFGYILNKRTEDQWNNYDKLRIRLLQYSDVSFSKFQSFDIMLIFQLFMLSSVISDHSSTIITGRLS